MFLKHFHLDRQDTVGAVHSVARRLAAVILIGAASSAAPPCRAFGAVTPAAPGQEAVSSGSGAGLNRPDVVTATAYLPALAATGTAEAGSWPMAAGNPQRTSWSSEEVDGNLHVEWYRPIEAYIPQHVQMVAAGGLIYISTAKGLYALHANTGQIAWRFDTAMPLGNSPTVDTQAGVLYVGGFDRKLHALNARTGAHLWEFAGAQAGYDTNPLVVDGKVILGNRDGNLYAIGAHGTPQQGRQVWKYTAGGPIRFSAAYKNGLVYFAANDNYAYAVRASNGTLAWKSQQQLSGDGFNSYWPVIFNEPVTHQDYVVFAAAEGYRAFSSPGANSLECGGYRWCEWWDEFNGDVSGTLGPIVQVNQPWAQGKTVVDYTRLTQYLENNPNAHAHYYKPWRRFYYIYNALTGQEYSMDTDHDGYAEYAPVDPYLSNSGNPYPPIVGNDGFLYLGNHYESNGQSDLMGWRMGTPYLIITDFMSGAGDEPNAFSFGGKLIYRSICCDRVGDWIDSTGHSGGGVVWNYDLSDRAPGYDQMWWFFDPAFLSRLGGNYGNINGVYHSHGDQNPIVPYQGRLFIHRSNAVIAFGPGTSRGKLPLITATVPVSSSPSSLTLADLTARLTTEVQKIVNAGHLRPGYYSAGQFNEIFPELNDYFDNPGDTLYTLSEAYPYLTPTLQVQVKTYLHQEYLAYFNPTLYGSIGWADGVNRAAMPLPPEVTADLSTHPKSEYVDSNAWSWSYPQNNFYAMWKYVQHVAPDQTLTLYTLAKDKLQVPAAASSEFFEEHPWVHNGYIAGYVGFLKLQELAGMTSVDGALRTQVTSELNRLLRLRVSAFQKDSPFADEATYNQRVLNIARNFMLLTPELGDYLNQNALSRMQTAINEYMQVGPCWFVSRYTASIGESTTQNLYDYPALFQANAYVLKKTRNELTPYIDAPAFPRGDLFYIQNLIAAIKAP